MTNIQDIKTYKENKSKIDYLLAHYFDFPVNKDNYILLEQEDRNIVTQLYDELTAREQEIDITPDNAYIFNKTEQLLKNSVAKGEI